jgi:hypothetical protein
MGASTSSRPFIRRPWMYRHQMEIRRPRIIIQVPTPPSMPELPSMDTWGDSGSESEAGTGAEFNTADPIQAEWSEIRDSERVYPLVNPIVHQHYLDGNIMRFPWFNDIPDKRFFAMVGIAHYSSLIDRHPRVSRWGAYQGCPIKEGQHITITPNLETQRPSLSIFVKRDDGSTVECKIHGSECVVFAVDGPGKLGDWWFEAGSEQHAQRSNDRLLQFRWGLKSGARIDFDGITKAELEGMNSEWLIAHPSDAFFVELLGDPIMSATITLKDDDPKLFAEYFEAMMKTASHYGNL